MTDTANKKYKMKVSSTRTDQTLDGFRCDYQDAIVGDSSDYTMDVEISITTEIDGEESKVAYFRSVLYDEVKLAEMGIDLEKAADHSAPGINDHAYWLQESEIYSAKADQFAADSWAGFILTWYIYPEYRNEGIATFTFDNLAKILKRALRINLRCASIYPQPQSEGTWENIFDPDMLVLMTDTVEDHGFVPAGKEGYYVKGFDFVG